MSTEFLVRTPDGSDYDHDHDYRKCRRQALDLGPGATVHPLTEDALLTVAKRADGTDQVLFRVPFDEPNQVG